MSVSNYFKTIPHTANTILEGMAVTFSHLLREPITVQYPDRTERPLSQILPDRYRGLLEVQMDICTGCKRCERACPIECIAIDLKKNAATKKQEMVRFDIDMGKCMYCGLCVEACTRESTGAIRHTTEFEAATDTFGTLTFRFIPQGSEPLYRAPKDKSEIPVGIYGPCAREARERAQRDNPKALEPRLEYWQQKRERERKAADKAAKGEAKTAKKAGAGGLLRADKAATIKREVATKAPKGKPQALMVLLEDLTAQTDCGDCGYPTCHDYSAAMASGDDMDSSKCAPGGAEATAHLSYAMNVYWKGPDEADRAAFGPSPGATTAGGAEAAAPAADSPATGTATAPAKDSEPAGGSKTS